MPKFRVEDREDMPVDFVQFTTQYPEIGISEVTLLDKARYFDIVLEFDVPDEMVAVFESWVRECGYEMVA